MYEEDEEGNEGRKGRRRTRKNDKETKKRNMFKAHSSIDTRHNSQRR